MDRDTYELLKYVSYSNTIDIKTLDTLINKNNINAEYNQMNILFIMYDKDKLNYDILSYILNKGININYLNFFRFNIMNTLCCSLYSNYRKYDILKLLIMYGININNKTNENYTSLHYLCLNNANTTDIKLLLDYGANINIRNKNGYYAITYCMIYLNNIDIIKLFVDYGANINITDNNGNDLYWMTADMHKIRLLANNNCKLRNRKNNFYKFIDNGAITLEPEITSYCIKCGKDIDMIKCRICCNLLCVNCNNITCLYCGNYT